MVRAERFEGVIFTSIFRHWFVTDLFCGRYERRYWLRSSSLISA